MKSPFVKKNQVQQFKLTVEQKKAYENAFTPLLRSYKPEFDFKQQIKNANTFDDLQQIFSKLEVSLLTNIAVSRLLEFSSHDLKQFAQYFDDTLNLVSCLEEEVDGTNDSNFNNKPLKMPKFKFDFDFDIDLNFDFLKQFRNLLYSKLEFFIVKFVSSTLLELIPYIDSDRINRCTVPCERDRNPYKNQFTKVIMKTGVNTTIFLQQKIKNNNLQISDEEMRLFVKQSLDLLTTDQIDCLLNGFLSSDILNLLIDLFKSLFDEDSSVVVDLLQDLDNIVDIVPGVDTLSPTTPCGDLHVESLERLKLEKQGFSPIEIENKIQQMVEDHKERLQKIGNILNSVPTNLGNDLLQDSEGPLQNAQAIQIILNKSIDSVFDPFQSYSNANKNILNRLLGSPVGDICIAFFETNKPQIDFNILPPVKNFIEAQLQPINLLDPFALTLNPDNFHSKYSQFFTEKNTYIQIIYFPSRIVMSVNGKIKVILEQFEMQFFPNSFQITLSNSLELNEFSQRYTREEALKTIISKNNNSIFEGVQFDLSSVMTNIVSSTKNSILEDIGKKFFFAEYNFAPNTKKNFIEIDYVNISQEKEKVKVEVNG